MRRILYAGLGLLAVGALALAVAWMARVAIAGHLLADRLAAAGFPDARFEITRVEWGHLGIAPLALGEGEAPAAERVDVRFAPLRLLQGDTAHLTILITGLSARITPSDGAPRIAGLPPAADASAAGDGDPGGLAGLAAIPTLRLRDARIELDSPVGRWSTRIDADFENGPQGPRAARIDAGIVNHRLVVEGELSADYDGERIAGSLNLQENDGFGIEASARLADPLGEARGRLEYRVDMPARADLPWAFLPGAPPASGRVTMAGEASGRVASSALPASAADWLRALAAGGWRGDYRVTARDLAMNARFEGLALDLAGDWQAGDEGLKVATAEGGSLLIERIAEPLWSRLSPPAALEPLPGGPVRLAWAQGERLRVQPEEAGAGLRLTLLADHTIEWPARETHGALSGRLGATFGPEGMPRSVDIAQARLDFAGLTLGGASVDRVVLAGGIEDLWGGPMGTLDLEVALGPLARDGVSARAIELELPLAIASAEDVTRIEPRGEGRVMATGIGLPGGLRGDGPVAARIVGGVVRLGDSPDYRLELASEAIRLIPREDENERLGPVLLGPGRLTASGALSAAPPALELQGFDLRLPTHGVEVAGIAARLDPQADDGWLRFSIDRLRETGETPRIAPVGLSGRIARRADGLRLSGEGRLGDGTIPFGFRGQAQPDASAGTVAFELPPVRFQPDGLQPVAAAPVLEALSEVEGSIGGNARITWDGTDVDGDASARTDGLDFTVGPASVLGLRGELQLDRLLPPRTAKPQRLQADAIDTGLRIDKPALEFSVERLPGGGPGLHIAVAEGEVIEGRIAVHDWRFDPAGQVLDPRIQVEGVALGPLLERLSIDGLEGRGTLNGTVPVFVTPEGVAIRDGHLRGLGGKVRYNAGRAERALSDTDRTVDLMLQALRDFEYDRIEIDLEREPTGDSRVDIRMEGRNPDVLDGHPFHFNISLTGDVEPLLQALARGRELTDELIRRNLQLRQNR